MGTVPGFVNLAGLTADGRSACDGLKSLMVRKAFGVHGQFGEQARRKQGASTRQGSEQRVVGVLTKQRLNKFAMVIDLGLQGAQDLGRSEGQLALGGADGRATAELVGPGEDLRPACDGFRAPQQVRMQKLFPAPLAGLRHG